MFCQAIPADPVRATDRYSTVEVLASLAGRVSIFAPNPFVRSWISAHGGGGGILAGATLARAEPLTTLSRSARSRVSLVARFKSACEDTTTSPFQVAAVARAGSISGVLVLATVR